MVRHGRKTRQTPHAEIKSQAAIFVNKNIPQTQLNTVGLCDQTREIVVIRTLVAGRVVTLASADLRRDTSEGHGAKWITKIAKMAANEALVIGCYFSAKHVLWEYHLDIRRSNALVNSMANIDLGLLHNTYVPTRVAEHNK